MARIYCTNCGQLVGQNANFCPFCGAATHGEAAAVYTHARETPETSTTSPPPTRTSPYEPEAKLVSQTIEREHVSPMAHLTFGLYYLRTTGVVFILGVVIAIFEPLVGALISVGYLVALTLITHVIWDSYYFSVDSTHFQKDHGIIHKKSVTIPFDQIQNVNITRTLIDQIFGLAAIDIETAGGNLHEKREVIGGARTRAEAHLSGMDFKRAKEVHDIILQKVSALHTK